MGYNYSIPSVLPRKEHLMGSAAGGSLRDLEEIEGGTEELVLLSSM